MKWINCKIKSLRISDVMLKKGFILEFDYRDKMYNRCTSDNPPYFGVIYRKDSTHIWRIKKGIQTANLIDGRFVNHKSYNSFEEYLK